MTSRPARRRPHSPPSRTSRPSARRSRSSAAASAPGRRVRGWSAATRASRSLVASGGGRPLLLIDGERGQSLFHGQAGLGPAGGVGADDLGAIDDGIDAGFGRHEIVPRRGPRRPTAPRASDGSDTCLTDAELRRVDTRAVGDGEAEPHRQQRAIHRPRESRHRVARREIADRVADRPGRHRAMVAAVAGRARAGRPAAAATIGTRMPAASSSRARIPPGRVPLPGRRPCRPACRTADPGSDRHQGRG